MNAAEARQLAMDSNLSDTDVQYNNIMIKIEEEAKKGRTEMSYYTTIFIEVRERLEKEGYEINVDFFPRSGITIKISW